MAVNITLYVHCVSAWRVYMWTHYGVFIITSKCLLMLYVDVSDCNGRCTLQYVGNVDSEGEINDVDNMQTAWVQTEL